MSSTNFTSGTVIASAWLNDVNKAVYTNTFPNSGGGTTNFLRADGTWAAPPGGASATLQQVIQNGNTSTNNAMIGGVGIGNQINAPTGLTVYGITSTANYVGLQNNFGGSTPYTALLSGAGFIPYPDNTLALGASPYRWASLSVGTGNFNWNNVNISAPTSGTTTGFLRQDGAWTNILTGNAAFGGVGIGNQLNAPTGTTVYGITSTADYVGMQSNFNGSSTYTVLLSGAAFLPYSNGSSTNSGIALGAPASLWSSLGVAGTFYWNNATITAPNASTGTSTLFLNQQGQWVTPAGSGVGLTSVGVSVPTGFSVANSPLTANGTIAISWSGQVPVANLGTGSPSSTTFLRGDGTWNAPTLNTVVTAGQYTTTNIGVACNSATSPTTSLGLGNQVNYATGLTVYGMTTQTSYVGMQNGYGTGTPYTVALASNALVPFTTTGATNQNISLGSSSYFWSNLYLASNFFWGNVSGGISAPSTGGTSTLFLNQQGQWATPSGTGSGLTSVGLSMPTGFSVSNTPLTANGTIAVSWSGYVPTANLGSGSASSSTYLRGDGTWSTVTAATPTLAAVCAAGSTYSGGITIGGTSTFNSYLGIGSTSSGPTGTAYGISTSTSVIGIGNNTAQTYLYGTAFVPSSDATLSLGSDTYRWQNIKVSGGASYFGAQSTFTTAPTVYAAQSTSGGITLAAYQGYSGSSTCMAAVINSTSANLIYFGYGSSSAPTTVGIISSNGTGVNYGSSSDRRLKSNIEAYTASGAFIDALLPRTFTWTATNTSAVGFVADELQTVCPDAVHGEVNGVDENGNPVYQSVDASTPQMIANIVAELQSLRARLKAANIQ